MKTLRQVCVVMALCLTLTGSVLAGDIDSPGKASTGTSSATTTVILTIVSLIYR